MLSSNHRSRIKLNAALPHAAIAAGSLLLGIACGSAQAGEAIVGAYVHDVDDGISYGKFENGTQIVVGARTTALDELNGSTKIRGQSSFLLEPNELRK